MVTLEQRRNKEHGSAKPPHWFHKSVVQLQTGQAIRAPQERCLPSYSVFQVSPRKGRKSFVSLSNGIYIKGPLDLGTAAGSTNTKGRFHMLRALGTKALLSLCKLAQWLIWLADGPQGRGRAPVGIQLKLRVYSPSVHCLILGVALQMYAFPSGTVINWILDVPSEGDIR